MITFVGTTYKMITAVTFPENPDANESPYFVPMLRLTHENYKDIDLVAADAAYIARVKRFDGTPNRSRAAGHDCAVAL